MTNTKLEGQVALVTGASRGIGKAIALDLAKHGVTVVGTATTDTGAANIEKYLHDESGRGAGMQLDVNSAERINAVVDEVQQRFGALGILVNNAGITRDNLLLRMKDEEWDDTLGTNLKAVFRLSRAVLRGMMKARFGRIINITSVVGVAGNAGQTNYAAAKAGMIGFTKSLAREVASRNITCNCVAPGFIETDMTRALNEEQQKQLLSTIPLGRLGSIEDVAAAVTYLAGPGGAYVTGSTLHVNGGMFMQ
jgi:3-oxoacyl-[acyl-carrier protein] reductase